MKQSIVIIMSILLVFLTGCKKEEDINFYDKTERPTETPMIILKPTVDPIGFRQSMEGAGNLTFFFSVNCNPQNSITQNQSNLVSIEYSEFKFDFEIFFKDGTTRNESELSCNSVDNNYFNFVQNYLYSGFNFPPVDYIGVFVRGTIKLTDKNNSLLGAYKVAQAIKIYSINYK